MKKTKSTTGGRTKQHLKKVRKITGKTGKTSAVRTPGKKKVLDSKAALLLENTNLRLRLLEAEETLTAIRKGEVDALVVAGPQGEQIYALKGAEQPYRVLVESMNEGALSLTENGIIINCNKAFSKIVGASSGMLIGQSFKDMVSQQDRERFDAAWKQGCASEAKIEVELQSDGHKIPAFVSLGARLHEGECWVFAVVTDIRERKRTEAELAKYRLNLEKMVDEKTQQLQATNEELQTVNEELQTTNEELIKTNEEFAALNKELDAFAFAVSHDLRAPLRHIDGFIHILAEDYAEKLDETGKDHIRRVQAGAEKMNNLIDALLNLSRFARSELTRSKVYLSTLGKTVADELTKTQPERRVEFTIADNMMAMGDQNMLKAAIANLFGNAWKFTEKRPVAKIEFGTTQIDGKDAYFVRDNGAGFDMKFSDKLYMPFQRLHTESEFPGLGIGLTIVQRVIHRHGGHVWAEGEIDKGATFYFTLS
ncbi:MAG TPA: ATP-binding protein [Nitrospirota bacterium]|nr:ATP-binding protein [Nitrospirota bacterium]